MKLGDSIVSLGQAPAGSCMHAKNSSRKICNLSAKTGRAQQSSGTPRDLKLLWSTWVAIQRKKKKAIVPCLAMSRSLFSFNRMKYYWFKIMIYFKTYVYTCHYWDRKDKKPKSTRARLSECCYKQSTLPPKFTFQRHFCQCQCLTLAPDPWLSIACCTQGSGREASYLKLQVKARIHTFVRASQMMAKTVTSHILHGNLADPRWHLKSN